MKVFLYFGASESSYKLLINGCHLYFTVKNVHTWFEKNNNENVKIDYSNDMERFLQDYLEQLSIYPNNEIVSAIIFEEKSKQINAKHILFMLQSFPLLKEITFNSCQNLNNLEIPNFSGYDQKYNSNGSQAWLSNLEKINLAGSNISSSALAGIISHAKKLKTINLSSCNNLKDLVLSNITLDNLEEINLHNTNIPTNSIIELLTRARNLKMLYCEIEDSLLSALHLKTTDIKNLHDSEVLQILIESAKKLSSTKETTNTLSTHKFTPMYNKSQQASASLTEDLDNTDMFLEFLLMKNEPDDIIHGKKDTILTESLSAKQIDYKRVKYIICEIEADVNIPNSMGQAPLDILLNNYTNNDDMSDLIELLLKKGAKINEASLELAKDKGCWHLLVNSSLCNKFGLQ